MKNQRSDTESELLGSFQQEEVNKYVMSGTVFMDMGSKEVEKGRGGHQGRNEGWVLGCGGATKQAEEYR